MNKIKLILLIFTLVNLLSCSNNKKEVVVYTTVDQVFSEPILKDFEKETGIKVKAVYDTEETKSTGVLNRLIAEKDNPQCDVFWSGDPVRTNILKEKGITQSYEPENAKDIPAIFKDSQNNWIGFSARARVLIYNTDSLKGDMIPQSIFDLIKPEYKGKVAIANPVFGTTTFHISALFTVLGDQKAKAFLDSLKNNNVLIAGSNGDVKKRVAKGEVWCGLTDTDDAFEAKKEGTHTNFVFLDQNTDIGTLIMPNTVNIIKNSPNTENGKLLMNYLLSKETEEKLAVSCAQMPLHKGVKTPDDIPSLDKIKAMKIDYQKTGEKLQEIQDYLKSWSEN